MLLRKVRASVPSRFVQHSLRLVRRKRDWLGFVALDRRSVGFASTALSHRVLPSTWGFGGIHDGKCSGNRERVAGDRLPAQGCVAVAVGSLPTIVANAA